MKLKSTNYPQKDGSSKRMRFKSALVVLATVVITSFLLTSCDLMNRKKNLDQDEIEEVTSLISFAKSEEVKFVDDDDDIPLKAELFADILLITNISWESSDPAIATVTGSTDSVIVKPQGQTGVATIRARLNPLDGVDLGNIQTFAEYTLRVIDLPTIDTTAIGDIMLKKNNKPRDKQVRATYTPDFLSAYDPVFSWEIISGSDKASFDNTIGENAVLTANSIGSGKVKAVMTVLGRTFPGPEVPFTVSGFNDQLEKHTSITIANSPSSIIATDTSAAFTLDFQPPEALYGTIDWDYDTSKFSLDYTNRNNIKLTALAGSSQTTPYTITAKSMLDTSVEASFTVTVDPVIVTFVPSIPADVTIISKGETTTYNVDVNAQHKTVNWSISGSIASVTAGQQNGSVIIKNTNSVRNRTEEYVMATHTLDSSAQAQKKVTFDPPTYTLVFDKFDSAATGSMNSEQKTFGPTYTLPVVGFSKANYIFDRWYTNTQFTGDSYIDMQQNMDIDPLVNGATITLYAKWISWTVSFNSDGGGSAPAPMQYGGTSLVLPNKGNMNKNSYIFCGWAEDSPTGLFAMNPYTPTRNVTLYAIWRDVYGIIDDGKARLNQAASVTVIGDPSQNGAEANVLKALIEEVMALIEGADAEADMETDSGNDKVTVKTYDYYTLYQKSATLAVLVSQYSGEVILETMYFNYIAPTNNNPTPVHTTTLRDSAVYEIELAGGAGGHLWTSSNKTGPGGKGGYVKGEYNVPGGNVSIEVRVGGQGKGTANYNAELNKYTPVFTSNNSTIDYSKTVEGRKADQTQPGGYNGGGSGGARGPSVHVVTAGSGGGGATDVRLTGSTSQLTGVSGDPRIAVAGGGGGAAQSPIHSRANPAYRGGNAGGLTGEDGPTGGFDSIDNLTEAQPKGATQTNGGAQISSYCSPGTPGFGQNGSQGQNSGAVTEGRGGGGGGWWGGGAQSLTSSQISTGSPKIGVSAGAGGSSWTGGSGTILPVGNPVNKVIDGNVWSDGWARITWKRNLP
ncbi:MAG: InlB B-repeat-containing protein [Spirochaetaceae bacterium]|jgi:hypothetical protein|nr:InlB B-repeat-containing protein [Spirochaetaceae bacterium]GMO23945.1 MAG: hypothetical protein Pg6A_11000 [Termitinemataceae bacterium]